MTSEVISLFESQKYVHLDDFLDKENCQELTYELKKLVEQKRTHKDVQCPMSESVHGAPVFDSLLEQLLPNFEQACGKKLYPTYAYARLYSPGDELNVHTDRESCEISATLTLGFDGEVWPIYMADYGDQDTGRKIVTQQGEEKYVINESKICMNVGDAVLYRGMEKVHWRDKYVEGKWQAQVFLHYVDANGKHAEWKFDKRNKLSHHNTEHLYFVIPEALPKDACHKLIESLEAQTAGEDALVGGGDFGRIDKKIRDVKKVQLPIHRGIGATMTGIGMHANMRSWNFNVTHSNQCEYLKYTEDGHYLPHVDTFFDPNSKECRKLTVLVFLNDDFEGGKLFLQNGHAKIYPPQAAGTALIFPSMLLHGVEPVTKGIRRSVVTWLVGPWLK